VKDILAARFANKLISLFGWNELDEILPLAKTRQRSGDRPKKKKLKNTEQECRLYPKKSYSTIKTMTNHR